MSSFHTVRQGEHLSRIAAQYGFQDFAVIWSHGKNAELKALRQNPNVLLAGDILFIPDKRDKDDSKPTDNKHAHDVPRPKLLLRVRLENLFEEPIANRPCLFREEKKAIRLTTNGQGQIEQEIPVKVEFVSVEVQPFDTQEVAIEVPIFVGHLDPVTEVTGWQSRLNNLGYAAGSAPIPPRDPGQTPKEQLEALPPNRKEPLVSAIEEFQCDHHLKVDGICGGGTQAKLKEIHGC